MEEGTAAFKLALAVFIRSNMFKTDSNCARKLISNRRNVRRITKYGPNVKSILSPTLTSQNLNYLSVTEPPLSNLPRQLGKNFTLLTFWRKAWCFGFGHGPPQIAGGT